MLATNLKILAVVLGTIGFYTYLAGSIPQVESEVPEELTLGANFTAEELVSAGEQLYLGAGGCTACHGTGTRAPNLLTADGGTGLIGERCGERIPDTACKDYLHQSLIDPNGFVVEGFQPIMPDMSRTLSPAQIWALVAYMESLGGEVTVSAADVGTGPDATAGAGAPAAPAAGAATTTTMEPVTLLQEKTCLVCHQLGDEGGPIGPPLTGLGQRRDAEFIRRKILDPTIEVSPGYEALAGTMPANFGSQLTAAQLEVMVDYLASQR